MTRASSILALVCVASLATPRAGLAAEPTPEPVTGDAGATGVEPEPPDADAVGLEEAAPATETADDATVEEGGDVPASDDATDEPALPDEVESEPEPVSEASEEEASEEEASEEEASEEEASEEPESFRFEYDPLHDSPQAIENRLRIRGGIALAAVGTALGVGAVIMGLSDPCRRMAGNSCQKEARNRAAITMGVPAAAMLVGGTTLLALGLLGQKRLRAAMTASRQGGGVVLWGRF